MSRKKDVVAPPGTPVDVMVHGVIPGTAQAAPTTPQGAASTEKPKAARARARAKSATLKVADAGAVVAIPRPDGREEFVPVAELAALAAKQDHQPPSQSLSAETPTSASRVTKAGWVWRCVAFVAALLLILLAAWAAKVVIGMFTSNEKVEAAIAPTDVEGQLRIIAAHQAAKEADAARAAEQFAREEAAKDAATDRKLAEIEATTTAEAVQTQRAAQLAAIEADKAKAAAEAASAPATPFPPPGPEPARFPVVAPPPAPAPAPPAEPRILPPPPEGYRYETLKDGTIATQPIEEKAPVGIPERSAPPTDYGYRTAVYQPPPGDERVIWNGKPAWKSQLGSNVTECGEGCQQAPVATPAPAAPQCNCGRCGIRNNGNRSEKTFLNGWLNGLTFAPTLAVSSSGGGYYPRTRERAVYVERRSIPRAVYVPRREPCYEPPPPRPMPPPCPPPHRGDGGRRRHR